MTWEPGDCSGRLIVADLIVLSTGTTEEGMDMGPERRDIVSLFISLMEKCRCSHPESDVLMRIDSSKLDEKRKINPFRNVRVS